MFHNNNNPPTCQYSQIVEQAHKGEGPTRRSKLSLELITQPENCTTLYESLAQAAKKYAKRSCLGRRTIIREEVKEIANEDGEKKKWTFYEKSPFKFQTYEETFNTIKTFAAGLRANGLEPVSKIIYYGNSKFNYEIMKKGR